MKEIKGMFKGLDIEKCWIPFTAQLIESSNLAMRMSGGEDIMYCKFMALTHDMLLTLYVDSKVMSLETYNRMFHVFVYVFETVYGDPYGNESIKEKYISAYDFFNNIKKHWNDNIEKEIQKYK